MKKYKNVLEHQLIALTDEEIIKCIQDYQSGNEMAGEQLILNSLPMIQEVASQWAVKGNYDIEDLIIEGESALLECILEFNPSCGIPFSLHAWVVVKTALKNHCKQLEIQKANENKYIILTDFSLHDMGTILLDKISDMESDYEEKEMISQIWQMVEELPDMDRTFLDLWIGAHDEPYTVREIGKMFDISSTTVNNRLKEILLILRNKLNKMGYLEVEPSKVKTDRQKRKLNHSK